MFFYNANGRLYVHRAVEGSDQFDATGIVYDNGTIVRVSKNISNPLSAIFYTEPNDTSSIVIRETSHGKTWQEGELTSYAISVDPHSDLSASVHGAIDKPTFSLTCVDGLTKTSNRAKY
ncbi:hypothetical protein ETB97_008523 [Aspergillus alliaceus]|uniref:Uncharacterized protein n=1 Tax=Petromyces alliaceus TaxID=209559 RepID=A0A8H6ABF9_PETAA|nr:hypothetical protein ETB97_008523 [Aspergillus burnettii]